MARRDKYTRMLRMTNASHKNNFTFDIIFCFSACSTTSIDGSKSDIKQHINIPINYNLFEQTKIAPLNEQELFYLTQDQQKKVKIDFEKKVATGYEPHQALYQILNENMANFTYYGETYNATTVMRLNKGNCMSLAILTTAYAKLLGLYFSYRNVYTLPIFSKKEDVILSSSHVQTVIYDPSFVADDNFFYFSPSGITIDYFPNKNNRRGGTFSYNTFVAMYYKNIAADALADKNLAKSFMYASTTYKYDTKNIETINLLAVIHRRAGDVKTAEAIYKIGIDRGKPNIALLSNYIMLLKSQQRMEEVSFLQSKMEELDDPSPYKSLTQAYVATQNNDIKQAERHFKKALKKAPYLNQAYMELYRIYIKQQKMEMAQAMLVKALEWTYELDEKKLYNINQSIARNI